MMNGLKGWKRLVVVAVMLGTHDGVAASMPPQAMKADTLVQDILDVERKRMEAVTGGDVETLKRLISRQYYHVESNGRLRTRTAFLQAVAEHTFSTGNYQIDDSEVQVAPDGGSAVVVGTFNAVSKAADARRIRAHYVRVWVRQGASWVNTVHQSTEITPAGAAAGVRPVR
ncbi:nuclear transport factor 2 family protein [uncultured Massilia sp.]|uniref:nuclear transport factor 2 family protein n=1 Tax=uncultured Massilia sp. TaxID=169973 RepID=UPI00258CCFCC|nr:nuclear transport factor 2 family protein [uncultured Massilia sp.]